MSHTAPIDTDALAYSLPAEAYHHLLHNLRRTLPPPPESPIDRQNRDHAIIAQISALRPNDSAEAIFAAQIVAAGEQWNDCLHWAQRFLAAEDYTRAAKCRAQAASMMREADRAQRALERMQAARRKLYANPDTTDAAERTEHITMVMLAEALAQMPEPTPAPTPVTNRPAPPAVAAQATSPTETSISKTTDQTRKHKNETPARQMPSAQAERPYESPARRAMLDQAMFGRREPDPNRRYPGESGAQLLMRRRQDADPPPAESPLAGMTRDAEPEMAVSCP